MLRTQTLSSHRVIVVALTVIAGLVSTIALWQNTRHFEEIRITNEFRQRAKNRVHLAREHISIYPELMDGLETIGSFNHPVFRAILDTSFVRLIERHPSIAILEWVPHIRTEDRATFEKRVSNQLGYSFTIQQRNADNSFTPATEADYYYPIQLAVPAEGNESVIGYDIRRAPTAPRLEQARNSRKLVATPQFTLAQASGPDDLRGIVLIMPVFAFDDRDSGDNFRGFIQCIFKIHASLAQIHRDKQDEALLIYYDDASATDPRHRIMYANLAGHEPVINNRNSVLLPEILNSSDPQVLIENLPIGGRDWRLIALINPRWVATQRSSTPGIILSGGILGTFLLSFLINPHLVRHREIARTVERRTADVVQAQQLLEKDITRRVIAEKSLRESETLLRGLLDNSTSEIFIKDLRGRYTMFNQKFQQLVDRPGPEIFGQTDFDLFPPDIAKKFADEDQSIITAKQPQQYETQLDVSGKSRTDIVQKFPLINSEGRAYAICGIVTDISYRVVAETERQELERKLQSSQRLESLGVLAGGIAHDFNNLLTTVIGHASLIREKGGHVSTHSEQLVKIEIAARRASDLCEQMLTYAGQNAHCMEPLDLNEIIRETIVLLSASLPKSIELPLELNPHLHAVQANATQLRQVVMNLVINAADAIGQNHGKITIHTDEKRFTSAELNAAAGSPDLAAGTYVVLQIVDTGPGIPPESRARIFEPFYTTKFHGRGLGLSTVLGIVQGHHGGLLIKSPPQTGTTFSVLLPATDQSPPPTFRSTTPEFTAPISGCALVVDDEETVREVTVAALEIRGLTVHSSTNGLEAIELFRQHHATIDLVLLDMTMPGLSGIDTLIALREIKPSIRAIILSGYSKQAATERLGDLEIDAFIQKPFEFETLLTAVAAIRPPS